MMRVLYENGSATHSKGSFELTITIVLRLSALWIKTIPEELP